MKHLISINALPIKPTIMLANAFDSESAEGAGLLCFSDPRSGPGFDPRSQPRLNPLSGSLSGLPRRPT
jgi:hypothetical protein